MSNDKKFYEEAADEFAKDAESALGKDYTLEDLLRFQSDLGLINPTTTGGYLVKKKIVRMREAQKSKPEPDRLTNRQINDAIAAEMNISYSNVYKKSIEILRA